MGSRGSTLHRQGRLGSETFLILFVRGKIEILLVDLEVCLVVGVFHFLLLQHEMVKLLIDLLQQLEGLVGCHVPR